MPSRVRTVLWFLAASAAFATFDAAADERWYWGSAQCTNESDGTIYEFVAVVSVDVDPTIDESGFDDARFGFGNHVASTYAEDACGAPEISAQNMAATGDFESRDEAAASLDAYVAREEAKGNASVRLVRVEDYADE